MKISIEYFETDCGSPCTPNGCMGHDTDIPVSITIDGISFDIENSIGGDFPNESSDIDKVKEVVNKLHQLITNE